MAGVLGRTSNSVRVRITGNNTESDWQEITVGGSVIFKWKLLDIANSPFFYYLIKFGKRNPSDKVNYIVTYTHWETIDTLDTAVMTVHTDHVVAVSGLGCIRSGHVKEVTVEISTAQSSSSSIIYDDDELSDFILRGEDGSVPFRKVVLAAHSSVFKTMLAGEWKETSEGVIDVPGTSKDMLQHLKKYMYSGKLPEKQNEQVDCIKQLLLLSSYYLIEDLKLRCIKELRFLIKPENVPEISLFALENKIHHLFVEILDCVAMDDIDPNEVRKHIDGEDATILELSRLHHLYAE